MLSSTYITMPIEKDMKKKEFKNQWTGVTTEIIILEKAEK